ncbi:MAG: phosphoglycerate kinase [Hyphomicrobiales bacterium]|nr:phosphoglycerate kinase [Hyphomicrobiales bacterium]MBV9520524.1 phosphoglycerate kinase [Hyphomicrobiales bacterium]
MTSFRTLDELDPKGKRILLRVDLNVPMEDGSVTDLTRIERVLPTIRELADKGGKVVLLAHFGRPKGKPDPKESLGPVTRALEKALGKSVRSAPDCIREAAASAVRSMRDGDVLLLENTRFHPGEEKNDPQFARALAANGDVFVNDAFSAAHRAHASTEGLAYLLPAYAGRAMQAELEALAKALETPRRPVAAIVGGAKVSTKLELLGNLSAKVEILIIGGGMANTFLAAHGIDVGRSLCEHELAKTALDMEAEAKAKGCEIMLPSDAVLATEFKAHAPHRVAALDDIKRDEMILDIGPRSVAAITAKLGSVATLVWNGPVGAFELPPFDAGTVAIARKAASLTQARKLVSIGGGGDTVAALNRAGVADKFTYVSTAGGAFLEWLEGKALPGVEALCKA